MRARKGAAAAGPPMKEYDLFAVTAHGLAELCARELTGLGARGEPEPGGVAWRGSARSMYRANLELRTASRVIARAGSFRARGFAELERHAAKLPWTNFLRPATSVALRVTCRKSKLYHERAVTERIARVLAAVAGVTVLEAEAEADPERESAAADGRLVIVRFLRDVCTISIDSSGALLHQRGYRQAIGKAPLRETIAAAMLHASGWRGDTPLLDPFCGSGTIPIEAALIARGIAPGLAHPELKPRAFAFEEWPLFERETWRDVVESARAGVREVRAPIIGTDRDGGVIAAARANAARAGVGHDIELGRATLSALEPPPGVGHLVTNPPYGVRVGDRRDLHALYAALGDTVRARLPGWTVTLLSPDDRLVRATGLPLEESLGTRNGGIPVRLLTGRVEAAAHSPTAAVYDARTNTVEDT